jgi:hypothetical protein
MAPSLQHDVIYADTCSRKAFLCLLYFVNIGFGACLLCRIKCVSCKLLLLNYVLLNHFITFYESLFHY